MTAGEVKRLRDLEDAARLHAETIARLSLVIVGERAALDGVIVELLRADVSVTRVAVLAGCTRQTIYQAIRRAGFHRSTSGALN